MEIDPADDTAAAYTETKAWLADHWSVDHRVGTWWALLTEVGLAFPHWPKGLGGRGWSRGATLAALRAFDEAHALPGPTGLGTLMGGPVVIDFGTDDQQRRFLPPLAAGTEGWCQLFSEPGAGSDLASVTTRATRDGDEWVISGQKVWTSGALHSKRGMLVARTDWDQPKHRGLSYFIIDLEQPGVEIRPLRQMNGKAHFSEVFFDEARVADADRISAVNNGWAVTVATLAFERSGLSTAHAAVPIRPPAGAQARQLDRTIAELLAEADNRAADVAEGGSFPFLLAQARRLGRTADPSIRQGLSRLFSHEQIAAASARRAAANRTAGRSPGPESSTAKLFWTEGLKLSRDLSMEILGPFGMLGPDDAPAGGRVQDFVLSMPSASIAGGSDEIQRNIIGERTLGLPKEPVVDADLPFRDVRRS